MSHITYTQQVGAALDRVLASTSCSLLFVLVDENTSRLVLPRIGSERLRSADVITIAAGDQHKNLDTLAQVWKALSDKGATRQSVLVGVGGGMLTDLGGLAAATFKRGIRFVNVPTTLLGAVDAAVGGKTGINFNGLKNEVGVFATASEVIISTCFFDTLPYQQLRSGYAEMIKHAMLDSHEAFMALTADAPQAVTLAQVEHSVELKRRVVDQDPHESGVRRVLNLGHTVGHAIESLALQHGRPVPHGYAVAWGLVTETVLSHLLLHFPSGDLHRLACYVRDYYGTPGITCDDYCTLLELMHHDKKSRQGEVNCTLLNHIGDPVIDNIITADAVNTALDIMRDYLD
ncbi:MAG: 3-dehydroquinate synthase [Muribaculaceae bacterium]|nr:3-dehydroquinate synthase [Muribaculaceae bacterium]